MSVDVDDEHHFCVRCIVVVAAAAAAAAAAIVTIAEAVVALTGRFANNLLQTPDAALLGIPCCGHIVGDLVVFKKEK